VKLRPYRADGSDVVSGYHHWCPACGQAHGIATIKRTPSSPVWSFNGDLERPTFHPSVRCFHTDRDTGKQETLCHYFVTDGQIVFCADNPHELNGQTVPLPEFPASWG